MRYSFLFVLTAFTAISCVSHPPTVVQLPPRARILLPDAPKGPVRVDVSLDSKTAQLLDSKGQVLAEMDISPGMPGNETPLGEFRVMEKLPLKRSNLYGQYVKIDTREVVVARHWEYHGPQPPGTVYQGIAMPFWLRLTSDGVGMHVGGFARNECTSKGCIRCPVEGQQFFYEHCQVGTIIHVHHGPHSAPSLLSSAP